MDAPNQVPGRVALLQESVEHLTTVRQLSVQGLIEFEPQAFQHLDRQVLGSVHRRRRPDQGLQVAGRGPGFKLRQGAERGQVAHRHIAPPSSYWVQRHADLLSTQGQQQRPRTTAQRRSHHQPAGDGERQGGLIRRDQRQMPLRRESQSVGGLRLHHTRHPQPISIRMLRICMAIPPVKS